MFNRIPHPELNIGIKTGLIENDMYLQWYQGHWDLSFAHNQHLWRMLALGGLSNEGASCDQVGEAEAALALRSSG